MQEEEAAAKLYVGEHAYVDADGGASQFSGKEQEYQLQQRLPPSDLAKPKILNPTHGAVNRLHLYIKNTV